MIPSQQHCDCKYAANRGVWGATLNVFGWANQTTVEGPKDVCPPAITNLKNLEGSTEKVRLSPNPAGKTGPVLVAQVFVQLFLQESL